MQPSSLSHRLKIEHEKLPSMPHSLLQLLELMSDPDVDIKQAATLIQTDPALTIRVLSIANTAECYGAAQYRQFNHLLVSLGLKTIKSIVINSAVQQFFSQFNIDDKALLAQFWQTSLLTAGIAKALAHIIGSDNEEEAYIAGLLHRVGELVCLTHDADSYRQKMQAHRHTSKQVSFYEQLSQLSKLEKDFIGADIPEVSALIVNGIEPQSLLGDALLYQRETAEDLIGTPHLLQIVNMAQKLASTFSASSTSDEHVCTHKETIFHECSILFDLHQPLLEDILKTSYENFLSTAESLGIRVNEQNKIAPDHQKAQLALAENVRTIALSSSLQQMSDARLTARPEKDLIKQIMRQLNILFDLPDSLFLAFNGETKKLTGRYSTHIPEPVFSQINIPLSVTSSLAVKSLIRKIPLCSHAISKDGMPENKKTVFDRQLLRLLNTEELLCLPLIDAADNSIMYGVLVAGVSAAQVKKIQREKGLLYEFAKASAEVISYDKNMSIQLQSAIEEEEALHSLEIRKLIHEANNPLGIMRNYLQILSIKMADAEDTKLQGQLEILMAEVERVGQIILRIRDIPQKSDVDNTQLNINELIEQLMSIFSESLFIKAGISTNMNLDKSIPLLKSNMNSLKQILTNLLKNATEAMPDGGTINVSTRDQVNYNGEQFIELSISDTGPGIAGDIMKNLFNPVKSTKTGEHSGLGLSIIKNLVNDLGGTISGRNLYAGQLSAQSKQQKISGAEFIILLPRLSGA